MDDIERTLPASDRRRALAREQGYAPRSAAFTSAGTLAVAAALWLSAAPTVIDQLAHRLRERLESPLSLHLGLESAAELIRGDVTDLGLFALWAISGIAGSAAVLNLLQTGFHFAPGALAPDPARCDPAQGFARLASPSNLVTAIWSLAVTGTIACGGAAAISFTGLTRGPASGGLEQLVQHWIGHLSLTALSLAGLLLVLCGLDVLRVRRQFETSLRMTPQEQREEAGRTPATRSARSRSTAPR